VGPVLPAGPSFATEATEAAGAASTVEQSSSTVGAQSLPRGDRAVPCKGGALGSASSVAKATSPKAPMVRPRDGGGAVLPRRPHPESYQISFPEYLNITPDGLRRRWSSQPAGPQAVVLFYDQGPLVADQFVLSNWFLSTAFAFCVPAWAEHEWLTSQGLPTQVEATFGEKPLMLLKAAVMRDATSYRAILEAATPAETKALGRQVRGFDQSLWSKRVCAVTMAVVRARAAALPELKALLLSHAGQYFAEASPRDTVHGIGLAAGDAKARQPKLWKGSNVLGWAYMTCAAELAGDARRRGKRKVSTGQTDGAFQEAIAEDMLNAEDKLRGGLASLGEGPAAKELTERRQVGETKL
jgi:ribA/ribD-fused uncharacterized protein